MNSRLSSEKRKQEMDSNDVKISKQHNVSYYSMWELTKIREERMMIFRIIQVMVSSIGKEKRKQKQLWCLGEKK